MRIWAKIVAGFVLALLMVAAIDMVAYHGAGQQRLTTRQMVHSHQLLRSLDNVISTLKDAETGQRGFVLTGQDRYLEPYVGATAVIQQELDTVARLTLDDAVHQEEIERIRALADAKLNELQATIDLRRSSGLEAAMPTVLSDRGKQIMDQIREIVSRITQREQDLLATYIAQAEADTTRTRWFAALSVPLSAIPLCLIAVILTRHIAAPLTRMARTAERISRGELVVESIASNRRDEVGLLQESFLRMTHWLRETAGAARQIAGQDLTVSIVPQSEQDELGHALATMVTNLRAMTDGLVQRNEELLASEGEIKRQNETLQQQSEEMDQQNEELQQQSEELQRQSEELQTMNEELGQRESILQTILASLKGVVDERHILENICSALPPLLGKAAAAAAVVERVDDDLVVHTRTGLGNLQATCWPFANSFAAIIMQENKTAYCEDLTHRPDLMVPMPEGTIFRSILASPLRLEGTPIGAIEVYSSSPTQWTTQHFRMLEWVAGQCSMALQIGRLRAELEKAAVSKARLASIVENSDDAIITKSLDGIILDWNAGAERMFGYRAEEAVGQPTDLVVPPERAEEEQAIFDRLRRGERIEHFETLRVAKDGHRIDVSATISAVKNLRGDTIGASAIIRDITERKQAEQALLASETGVRRKLESILSPESDISDLELGDIIDTPAIQSLMEDCYELMGMAMAVIDLKGKILVGVGWQDICTQFHRVCPESCRHCVESDTQLTTGVTPGEFRLYHCKNNMWDVATPIMVGGKHMGNIFSGQFFFEDESPDRDLFRAQAQRYGFDEDAYLAALDCVPKLTHEKVNAAMSFFVKLADIISLLSYSNLKLARSLADRDALTESLRTNEQRLYRLNRTLMAMSASGQAMIRATDEAAYLADVCRIIVEDCGHAMVWIGFAEDDAERSVRPVASAGFEEGYLDTLRISWADTPRGRGPTGTAIRTGERALCHNMVTDPQFAPWREQAIKRGYASSVAIPLVIDNRPIGALTIYSHEPDPFSEDELELLSELANDLSHGIFRIRARAAQQQAEEALHANEEQLHRRAEEIEKLMDIVPVAIWLSEGPDCRRITGNRMANALYEAAGGENVSASAASEDIAAHRRFFRHGKELSPDELPMQYAAAHNVEVHNSDFDVELPNGRRVSLLGSALPLRDSAGQVRGCLGAFLDISERTRLEQERLELLEAERAARSEVERTNRMKDEFLATVSHELRSPLGAIVGWAGLLAKGKVEVDKATGIIRQSAASLTQLVEDLLDMSRIISGKIRLQRGPVNVVQIINNVVESVQFTAQAKSIHVAVSFEPFLRLLECDENRVQQIVWNLLTNAIKFTPEGGLVMVSVSQNDTHLTIRVQDNGKGISPQFLPHIFERFRQQDGSIARHHGGLGLGLAIVKHLVELHGGEIWAESEGTGKGATFVIDLPFGVYHRAELPDLPQEPTLAQADSHVTEVLLRDVKIICVDDDPYWRELAERSLSDCGAIVQTAGSAQEAFTMLDAFHPDVLISDVGMPGEDGFTFIRRLRAADDWKATLPCIAVTALGRHEDRQRSLKVGFDEHLGKPFDPGSLCVVVSTLLKSEPPESAESAAL